MNKICFVKDQYETPAKMWASIAAFLRILEETENIAVVRSEDVCVIVEYEHDDPSWGTPYPYWLTEEEYEQIDFDDEEDIDSGDTDYV